MQLTKTIYTSTSTTNGIDVKQERGISASDVPGITQLAKLSFDHPSVVLTADAFEFYFVYKIEKPQLRVRPMGGRN